MRKLFTATITVGQEEYFRMVDLVTKYNVRNSTEILCKQDGISEIRFKINKKNLEIITSNIELLKDFGIQTKIEVA